jgi:glycosyltransferase involved in cell wall biosynthesis
VKKSFLKEYPLKVIYNGTDIEQFKPNNDEKIAQKYGLEKGKWILGVASTWDRRKGLDDFATLRKELSPDIQIVLVGLNAKQISSLPAGIRGIARTENRDELAALYAMANVFVNPTYVDNFPTTNIEALACGTPVITYRTGGSPEAIDEKTGIVVEKGNIRELRNAIEIVLNKGKEHYSVQCRERAVSHFDKNERYNEYVELFNQMIQEKD